MKTRAALITLGLACALLWASCGDGQVAENDGKVTIDSSAKDTSSPQARIAKYSEHLKYGPKNWELWYQRSIAFYEMGNVERAMVDIEKAIEYSITEPQAYHMRGFYYYVLKNDSAALRDFQRAAELGSENPETYHQIGNIYFLKKDYAEADKAYDHAMRLDSLQPTYPLAKGLMRRQQGQVDAAIALYNEALMRDPTFIKALLALHDVYLEEKHDPDRAYTFNERVMLIDSTQPLAHFNQGNFFRVRANNITDESKRPDFEVLLKIAISEYNLCIKYDPTFVDGLYSRGYTFYLLGKYDQALKDFSKVTELDPFHRDGFYMRANIQEYQGDLSSALANYQRALDIDPDFRDAAVAVKELSQKVKGKGS